jgi:hypothetical protein
MMIKCKNQFRLKLSQTRNEVEEMDNKIKLINRLKMITNQVNINKLQQTKQRIN